MRGETVEYLTVDWGYQSLWVRVRGETVEYLTVDWGYQSLWVRVRGETVEYLTGSDTRGIRACGLG